ncbi:MAG: RIP metalloprotease RseP [Mucilaginibacter polytrichastri]|nr:RIP metalloprotease RseP [Mucilaginibacter polytrichastri]
MNIVIMVAQLLLGLSILVILHELGHFIAARAFGIKVEKFYLFFDAWGVSLFKFNYKGVEYGVGWLPLGGYVKIAGMVDESMDTEQLQGPPQPWEFRSKPAWQRLIVMLGGIIVNIILGIFIFWMLTLRYGETYIPNSSVKYGIVPGKIGREIGLKPGDKITEVNGKEIVRFEELLSSKVLLGGSDLTIQRDGKTEHVQVPNDILNEIADLGADEFIQPFPRSKFSVDSVVKGSPAQLAGLAKGDSIVRIGEKPVYFFDDVQSGLEGKKNQEVAITVKRSGALLDLKAKINSAGSLGFFRSIDTPELKRQSFSFFNALPIGASKAIGSFTDNAKGIGKVVTGQIKANKAFSGPVAIAGMFGSSFDWMKFWSLVGLLSMALALMNLLPIPALDGGHALFLIIEMIKGKPLSDKFLERAQIVGFFILVVLMVFVFGNDILRAVHKP